MVVAAALTTLCFLAGQPPYPWLFKGAYANYYGKAIVLSTPVKASARLEVLDYNSTHVKVLTHVEFEPPVAGAWKTRDVYWVDLRSGVPVPENSELTWAYEQEVYIEGVGARTCVVYEFTRDNSTIIYYVDKEAWWPLKISISTSELELDLEIAETNIPGLSPGEVT